MDSDSNTVSGIGNNLIESNSNIIGNENSCYSDPTSPSGAWCVDNQNTLVGSDNNTITGTLNSLHNSHNNDIIASSVNNLMDTYNNIIAGGHYNTIRGGGNNDIFGSENNVTDSTGTNINGSNNYVIDGNGIGRDDLTEDNSVLGGSGNMGAGDSVTSITN